MGHSVADHMVLRRFSHLVWLVLVAALLCRCGLPQPPQCRTVPDASRVSAVVLVAEARRNWEILGDPSRAGELGVAQNRYNEAVAKLFDQLRCGKAGWQDRASLMGTRIADESAVSLHPSRLDAVFPASSVNVRTVKCHKTTSGVGVPLVGWKKTSPVGMPRDRYLLPNGLPYLLTAVLSFESGGQPVWHFVKRWNTEQIQTGRVTHTLAADWSAPNAFFWGMCELDDLTIQNVILPERFMQETGLYFLTPYDPEKIPVVMVHGLVSSPDAFKNIINELAPEPWFRQNYQIWLFNYPTGNPWLLSSMKFRESMREACAFARSKGNDRNLRRMVVVGHSMGGLIARSSVTDPGSVIYDEHFKQPIDQLKLSPATRELIRETMLYDPLQEPSRVVFMAVPHRGSPMATRRISTWISGLIRLPKTLTVDLLDATFQTMGEIAEGREGAAHLPNSINSLSPASKANIALGKLPLPKRIAFHSVIGDRGRGDSPGSSDGVVPYWSSHVSPVRSERIVPSNHSVPNHPAAAEELKRILRQHLAETK